MSLLIVEELEALGVTGPTAYLKPEPPKAKVVQIKSAPAALSPVVDIQTPKLVDLVDKAISHLETSVHALVELSETMDSLRSALTGAPKREASEEAETSPGEAVASETSLDVQEDEAADTAAGEEAEHPDQIEEAHADQELVSEESESETGAQLIPIISARRTRFIDAMRRDAEKATSKETL